MKKRKKSRFFVTEAFPASINYRPNPVPGGPDPVDGQDDRRNMYAGNGMLEDNFS